MQKSKRFNAKSDLKCNVFYFLDGRDTATSVAGDAGGEPCSLSLRTDAVEADDTEGERSGERSFVCKLKKPAPCFMIAARPKFF